VAVRGRRVGGRVELSVVDTGIGIAPSMLETIFQPFVQTRQSIARSQGGLGLGLAIVSNLVELHGGTVLAKSAGRGQGSEFIVTLPAIDAPTNDEAPSPPSDALGAPGNGRLLIVDDNVDAAEMLRDLLVAIGYDVSVAHDGPAALEVAETFRPQLGILDLGLPVMDGFELAHQLQARTHLGSPKLVALTGYGQAEDVAKTSAAGFAAHLVKPLDFARLRALMEELLERP
jgi:CheY-like chemotaxis protein